MEIDDEMQNVLGLYTEPDSDNNEKPETPIREKVLKKSVSPKENTDGSVKSKTDNISGELIHQTDWFQKMEFKDRLNYLLSYYSARDNLPHDPGKSSLQKLRERMKKELDNTPENDTEEIKVIRSPELSSESPELYTNHFGRTTVKKHYVEDSFGRTAKNKNSKSTVNNSASNTKTISFDRSPKARLATKNAEKDTASTSRTDKIMNGAEEKISKSKNNTKKNPNDQEISLDDSKSGSEDEKPRRVIPPIPKRRKIQSTRCVNDPKTENSCTQSLDESKNIRGKTQCPLCNKHFANKEIEAHAASCGDNGNFEPDEDSVTTCNYCDKVVLSSQKDVHQKKCENQFLEN